MNTPPEQWLPPLPITDAEQMARAIYAQCAAQVIREHVPIGALPSGVFSGLRSYSRSAADFYFRDKP